MPVENGMPADTLVTARWRKSSASNPSGCCVEVAELPGGEIAVRNSRDKSGPALIYTRAEVAGFLRGLRDGEFDSLAGELSASQIARPGRRIEPFRPAARLPSRERISGRGLTGRERA